MQCKKCGGDTKVTSTVKEYDAVHRIRACKKCGEVVYTSEYESNDKYHVKDLMAARFRTSKYLKSKK